MSYLTNINILWLSPIAAILFLVVLRIKKSDVTTPESIWYSVIVGSLVLLLTFVVSIYAAMFYYSDQIDRKTDVASDLWSSHFLIDDSRNDAHQMYSQCSNSPRHLDLTCVSTTLTLLKFEGYKQAELNSLYNGFMAMDEKLKAID